VVVHFELMVENNRSYIGSLKLRIFEIMNMYNYQIINIMNI
jgi:hypothetical protein